MLDFVAEARPRTSPLPRLERPQGFVAEIRPTTRQTRIPNTRLSETVPESTTDNLNIILNDILSNNTFSKEKITNVMHDSVVKLIKTLLSGYRVAKIQGCINVSLTDTHETICVNLNDVNNENGQHNVDNFLNQFVLKYKGGHCISAESPQLYDDRSSARRTELSPIQRKYCYQTPDVSPKGMEEGCFDTSTMYDIDHITFERGQESSEKSDIDEESGYSGSEKDSVYHSDANGEDFLDSPKSTREVNSIERFGSTDGPGHNDNNNKIPESELVIDLSSSPNENVTETKEIDEVAKWQEKAILQSDREECPDSVVDENKEPIQTKPLEVNITQQATVYERSGNVVSCDTSDDDTFTNIPMDLSGDCKINVDVHKMVSHSMSFTRETIFPCRRCPATFLNPTLFEKNTLQHHQLHVCPTCFKEFSSKNNLKRHVRIHTGSRPYKCGQCALSFARKDDLKGHTRTHDFTKPFRCSLCKKGYTDRACVKNHMSKEHCSRLMRICPQCGESFDREEAFREHKKTHPSLKQFSCDTCPFIGTNHLMALKHKLLHSYKLFACKPCNAYFADPFDYTKHVRKHKKSVYYSFYVCCFCGVSLPTYSQFVRHEYSHAQGKLHECIVCNKQFKSKALMQEHSLVHCDDEIDAPKDEIVEKNEVKIHNDSTEIKCDQEVATYYRLSGANSKTPQTKACDTATTEMLACNDFAEKDGLIETFEESVLDLSVESDNASKPNLGERNGYDHNSQLYVDEISNQDKSSMSPISVPRNGYTTIDTRFPENEDFRPDNRLSDSQICSHEEFSIVWQSRSFHRIDNKKDKIPNVENTLNLPLDHKGTHKMDEASRTQEKRLSHLRNDHRRPHPYYKMIALASKFMAARGNNLKTPKHTKVSPEKGNVTSLTEMLLKYNQERQRTETYIQDREQLLNDDNEINETNPSKPIIGLSGNLCLVPGHLEESCAKVTGKISASLKEEAVNDNVMPLSNSSTTSPENAGPLKTTLSERNRHECISCNGTFESFHHLESHTVINHNRYLCEFCGKSFTARPNRDRHVRYHTGERPYKCDLCSSAFHRGDDLKYHRTTRHPTEQITCNRCDASFTWQKDLERHLRYSKCVSRNE